MLASAYGYSLFDYQYMVGEKCRPRVDAFSAAIRQAVTPDTVVLEIGSGPGVFALMAARAGARKVYAIDVNPMVRLGPELARANGLAEQIVFRQIKSTELELPEPVDVIVSDMRGTLPFLADHLVSIRDARERLLRPGGTLIPVRDTLWGALVHAPEPHGQRTWEQAAAITGLDFTPLVRRTVHYWSKLHVAPEQLLTPPQRWAELDYMTVEHDCARGELRWTVDRSALAHGVVLWFESELAPGISFSNAPTAPHIPVYSQSFFPWQQPVALEPDDVVEVTLRGHLVQEDYSWSWVTRVQRGGATVAHFKQASFAAQVPSLGT
jgi:protein arginine N-methyltransferase 1